MGLWASKLAGWVWSGFEQDPVNILMLGIDAAGKTTITYKLKLNEAVCTIPTIGFNVETIDVGKGVSFTVWDIGGQTTLRPLWHHYYRNASGLIFVVDSSDRSRLQEAREEFHNVIAADEMRGVPVVVLANKQDLPNACSAAELTDKLGLQNVRDREWYIQSTCATTGDGLYEGMHQMADLTRKFKKKDTRA